MRYEDYIGNLARLAVELVNAGSARELSEISVRVFDLHDITRPGDDELRPLLAQLRPAIEAVADGSGPEPINRLLDRYPPVLHVSVHGSTGGHLHFARNGESPISWIGRGSAAALAHIACGVQDVTIGRCAAANCERFFVDQSRNHSRRFCGNTCASRTTVAAYRSRHRTTVASH